MPARQSWVSLLVLGGLELEVELVHAAELRLGLHEPHASADCRFNFYKKRRKHLSVIHHFVVFDSNKEFPAHAIARYIMARDNQISPNQDFHESS